MAHRWINGEHEQVRQELGEMIMPARLVIIGAVLAELHNTSEVHTDRFVSMVLDNELGQYAASHGARRRGRSD
jgi:hypothetical protein